MEAKAEMEAKADNVKSVRRIFASPFFSDFKEKGNSVDRASGGGGSVIGKKDALSNRSVSE